MDDKIMFSARIDPELRKALKLLAVETDKNVSDLTEEALRDLLTKYKKKKSVKKN